MAELSTHGSALLECSRHTATERWADGRGHAADGRAARCARIVREPTPLFKVIDFCGTGRD
jgi:hypothetical protein